LRDPARHATIGRSMRLPYFPLHVVVFPHLPLPIHVFEERYRLMAQDVVADGSPFAGRFVVAMITDGSEVEAPGTQPVRAEKVGTIVEVRSAERFADGRWALLAVGVARALLSEVDHSGAYATVRVQQLPDDAGDAERATSLLPQVQAALDAYMETVKRFVASAASLGADSPEITTVAASLDEVLKPIRLPDDPLAASYAVGGVLQIELTRKQQLLELPDAATRLRAELDLLRREARLLRDGAMPPVATADLRYHPN
jgi:Lon protease-like protein